VRSDVTAVTRAISRTALHYFNYDMTHRHQEVLVVLGDGHVGAVVGGRVTGVLDAARQAGSTSTP
jgi:hypothetical protein